nr:Chain P, CONALBUMIN PEPTIDE [Mus musculus]1D9K_Q Chain Q, CONALBUMIN PEPTIDE [Mus musculus]1JL4_C Chain C, OVOTRANSFERRIN [Gallus gallus]
GNSHRGAIEWEGIESG